MISIRQERPGDVAAVREINEKAFGQPTEAGIVDSLREACSDAVSLVAVKDGRVVGHVFFSPVTVEGGAGTARGMGLAPLAVRPECRRQGVGSRLVEAGLEALRRRACPFVIVVGDAKYYARFGFVPASLHGLACQWEGVPEEAFMALILDSSAMAGVSGVARYRSEFDPAV